MSEIDYKKRHQEDIRHDKARVAPLRRTISGFLAGVTILTSCAIIGNQIFEDRSTAISAEQNEQDQRVAGICHNLGANAMRGQLDPGNQAYFDSMCAKFSAGFRQSLENPSGAQVVATPNGTANVSQ